MPYHLLYCGMICVLHLLQSLREGVLLDLQRQEMKRRQNTKALQDQIELTNILEKQRQEMQE